MCADVEEYRYADAAALLRAPDPVLVALDEVTDPQNLGAVCRTAECAGATGVILPERRSAEVTAGGLQGVGRGGRAPRDRAGAQPGRLPRRGEGRGLLDATARRPAAARRTGRWTGTAGVVLVLGAEGRGLRPRVAAACDALVSLPLRGRIDSLNVSATAAVFLYEILQQRLDTST